MSGWHIRDNLLLRFCSWLLFSLSLILFICLSVFVCLFVFCFVASWWIWWCIPCLCFLFCCKFVKMVIHSLSLVLIPCLCFWFLVFDSLSLFLIPCLCFWQSTLSTQSSQWSVGQVYMQSWEKEGKEERLCVLKWHLKSGFSSVLSLWWNPSLQKYH